MPNAACIHHLRVLIPSEDDLLLIAELADDAAAAAVSLNIGAAGALEVAVTVLIEPETIDEAVNKGVPYRVPGG